MKWKYGGAPAIGNQAIHLALQSIAGRNFIVCCYHLLATILARCQHLCAMQRLAASCMALYAACMEGGASDNS